jgi:hypothetical protein
MYICEKKSCKEIAKELNCCSGTIWIYLKKFDIKIRSRKEGLIGRPCSEKTRKKISQSLKGKKPSNEHRRKIKENHAHANISGEKHYNWKGGIKNYDGRIFILKPDHPHANKSGYVRQSRLVMEEKLGRYLKPSEVVHHKNGKKDDDRPENLELFESQNSHTSFHHKMGDIK